MRILIINYCVLGLILIGIVVTCKYHKEEIIKTANEVESPSKLQVLYPTAYFLNNFIIKTVIGKQIYHKIKESLRSLYVREDSNAKVKIYCCRLLSSMIAILIGINLLSILIIYSQTSFLENEYYIRRPNYGDDARTVNLLVGFEERYSDVAITLQERKHVKEEQVQEIFQRSKQYLDQHTLGNNSSYNSVTEELNLVNEIPEFPVTVRWELDEDGIIGRDGKLNIDENDKEGKLITIRATLNYYNQEEIYSITMVVYPKEKTEKEILLEKLQQELQVSQDKDPESEYVQLPKTINNKTLTYKEEKKQDAVVLNILGLIAVGFIGYGGYIQLEKNKQKKNKELLLRYPDMINKIVLLVGAGMTIKNAWGRMCEEYEEKLQTEQHKQYLYEEMLATYHEIQNGVTELEAYERFGRRVKLVPYMKLSTLLAQNCKKGSSDLLRLLEYESIQAFEERKEMAKRLGEEAGTKLLAPMVMMLFIVLMIIMIPAFMQM